MKPWVGSEASRLCSTCSNRKPQKISVLAPLAGDCGPLTPLAARPKIAVLPNSSRIFRRYSPLSGCRYLGVVAAMVLSFAWSSYAEKPKDLRPQGYVSDFAGILSDLTKNKLDAICEEVDHKAQAQIAIVTVKSLEGEPIEQYSVELAEQWGIGPKGKDRGIMILVAPNEHRDRFEVGYGLEPILPDGKVGGFSREAVPLLRQGDYDAAVLLFTQRVAAVIAQDRGVTLDSLSDAPPPPAKERSEPAPASGIPIGLILFLIFFVGFPLLRMMSGGAGRRRGIWWMGGPWIGGGGWGGGGFGGGGGGSGGGGFGGFGGGSFGGGGASGSW